MDGPQLPTPDNIARFLQIAEAFWPTVMALIGILTICNRIVQRLPDRFARFKNIVAPLTIDLVELLLEVGGALRLGPRKAQPVETEADTTGTRTRITFPPRGPGGPTAGAAIVLFGALFALAACTPAELQRAQAKALPVLTELQSAAVVLDQALKTAERNGVSPEAIRAAKDAWDRGEHGVALVLAHGALKTAAELGGDIPKPLVASLQLAIRLAEAKAFEDFGRAVEQSKSKPTGRLDVPPPEPARLPPYDPRRRLARSARPGLHHREAA